MEEQKDKNLENNQTGNQPENKGNEADLKSAEELKKRSEEIEERIAKAKELLKGIDTDVISEEAQSLLDKISALRKEKRRIEELIASKKAEGLKEVVFEKTKSLGLNEEDSQKVFERLKELDLSIEDADKIEAEIKKVVPSLKPEEYWKMKEQLAKQAEMTNKNVQENVNAGSPDTNPNEEEFSEEVLKYAQEHGIEPKKAQKILQRFSQKTRKIM